MSKRRVWVKRPAASATLITIASDELVDDLRDQILRKYANSLGRSFDAPDVEIRILPRAHALPHLHEGERRLTADEQINPVLDSYFPGGQSVEEALLIEVPASTRRATPRASPRVIGHVHPGGYEGEAIVDYFSNAAPFSPSHHHSASAGNLATAAAVGTAPLTGGIVNSGGNGGIAGQAPHSMAIVTTGKLPALPSPGGRNTNGAAGIRHHRPRNSRTLTTSPTLLTSSLPAAAAATAAAAGNVTATPMRSEVPRARPHRSRGNSDASDVHSVAAPAPTPPPLPTPPAVSDNTGSGGATLRQSPISITTSNPSATNPGLTSTSTITNTAGGPVLPPSSTSASNSASASAVSSPHPSHPRASIIGKKKPARTTLQPSTTLLPGTTIPPINCLIVEDNIINLRLLEAFMKRLRVRWATALNGREAVTKWRTGGFHLVLMDIQLPVMNGLEATKEIRRLERVNGIGVYPSTVSASLRQNGDFTPADPADVLGNEALFKSPVIVVALTASSLQSDRHEALAAGCNDFLTKPVSFPWLERKVMEWGCMQALIDFDGWRAWKAHAPGLKDGTATKPIGGGGGKSKGKSGAPSSTGTGSGKSTTTAAGNGGDKTAATSTTATTSNKGSDSSQSATGATSSSSSSSAATVVGTAA